MKPLLRLGWVQRRLAWAVFAYARTLRATIGWRIENQAAAEAAVAAAEGAVVLFWHGRIGQAMACRDLLGGKPRRVMISLSRDGDFISLAAERLGVPVIRGSTGKGGAVSAKGGGEAFREALAFLKEGGLVLLTPDGPRGPFEVLSMGAVRLAAVSDAPVYLAGFAARPALSVRSWDRAQIPLPFARGSVVVAGPFAAPARDRPDLLEATRTEWESRLRVAQTRAEALSQTRGSGWLRVYCLATTILAPAAPMILAVRAMAGREDWARRRERLGRASQRRAAGDLVWLHGASIGESVALLPLMEAIHRSRPEIGLLVTTGTRTSAAIMAERAPAGAIHQYAPMDTPGAASAFLDHWRPRAAIFAESELWPNLILEAKARGVRLALVSARMSEASHRRWRQAREAARTILGAFDLIVARDELQAAKFGDLGASPRSTSDLRFAAPPLPVGPEEPARLRRRAGSRPLILAASTHRGEESLIIENWRRAGEKGEARPLLVIAPRHPTRGDEIARQARSAGLTCGLRSENADPRSLAVYIADTIGEMGLLYRLADLAILGGSFVTGVGGHNPIEPALLSCPFVSGPQHENWPVFDAFEKRGGTRILAGIEDLGELAARLLGDARTFAPMAERARVFVDSERSRAEAGIAEIVALVTE